MLDSEIYFLVLDPNFRDVINNNPLRAEADIGELVLLSGKPLPYHTLRDKLRGHNVYVLDSDVSPVQLVYRWGLNQEEPIGTIQEVKNRSSNRFRIQKI